MVPDIPDYIKPLLEQFDKMYPNALAADTDMPVDDEIYQEGDLALNDIGLEADQQDVNSIVAIADKQDTTKAEGGCCTIFWEELNQIINFPK